MALRTALAGSFLVAADAYATHPKNTAPVIRPNDPACNGIDTAQQLTVALEPDWGDYSTCDGNECSGVVQPLVDAVCSAAGLNCVRTVVPWTNIWDGNIGSGFKDNTFQIAAAAGNTGPRGDKCMHFSNPYTQPGSGIVLATPAIAGAQPAEGSAVTFCALKGWAIGSDYLNEAAAHTDSWMGADRGFFSKGYAMTVVDMYETGNELIAAHEAGACHYSLIMAGSVADPDNKLVQVETVSVEHHRVGGISFMVDGEGPYAKCLLSKLNTGLDEVRASGGLAAMAENMDISPIELEATFENPKGCVRI